MSIKKRLDKKLIILALLLVLIIGIGAVSAADNNTYEKLASSNDQVELSVSNDVKISSSNESTLGANVEFSGTTFTELETAINNAGSEDTIVLNNDITNDRSKYVLIGVGKSITIEGNGHKIDALGKSGIFFIKGSGVVLNNITFTNAINSFDGQDNMMGGAIGWMGSNGVVNNSVFINNTADSGTNSESGHGGAIDWIQAEGGKIYNSKFYNNYANLTGGALRVKSSITIVNSTFSYNEAPDGGAIDVLNQGQTYGRISNCTFSNNIAENNGGAIYLFAKEINLFDNYYTLNSAKYGGAAYVSANNNLVIKYETVIANFAERGGGFYLVGSNQYTPVQLEDSIFLNNTAYELGAGVYYYDGSNGYSDVDLLNSPYNHERSTVQGDKGILTWWFENRSYMRPVINTYFGGSMDNYLGVEATPNGTTVIIDLTIPKNADQTTADINLVIKDESGNEYPYHYDSSDSRWNYDNMNYSAMTVVTLTLTNQQPGNYNVTATFKDDRYYRNVRQGNTTYTIERPKEKGNFTILQELINEAINTKTYVVDLDRDYTYSIGLDHGQMNIYDNITINGNGHFLDALGKCRIFAVSGNNVELNNIIFRNGNATGADGTFSNYEYGGAIYWSSGDNATVNNCTFTNNYALHGGALVCGNMGNVYINDTVFAQNTAGSYAGALYLYDNNKLIISNSTFKYGNANYGSAIYCNGDNYNIYSCNFTNNTAVAWSTIEWVGSYGNIYGTNFTNNNAGSNAAITFHGNNCTASHCLFDSNNATTGPAGAILIDGNDNAISNCSFTNNSAYRINGGSIVVLKDNGGNCYDTYIYDSIFRSGIAQNGGAIYFNNANLIVHNSTFEFNHAHVHGGAICADGSNSKSTIISNCTFKSNEAADPQGTGGAISYSTGSDDLIVSDCTFESNSQLGTMLPESPTADIINSGGAIYFDANILKVDNCNFTYNCVTADYVAKCYSSGGAITAYGSKCDISNSIFKHNSALKFGGAFETNIDDFTISNCTFEYNNASSGSAVLSWGDGGKVSNSTFLNNRADSDSLLIQDNDLTLTITLVGNDNYINAINIAGDLTFKNVTYYNGQTVNSDDVAPVKSQNEAGQTIVLEFDEGSHIIKVTNKTDVNGQFIYDYSELGAGIHFYNASHPQDTYYTAIKKKDNVKFGEFDLLQHHVNQADDNGVLNLVRNYTYTINIDSITNGVVINKKNLTINGNNHTIDALSKSRIFYVGSEDVVLNNITYKNGIANDGGAIFVNGSATNLTISNATFENNLAKMYGGAIFWNCSSGNINHAIFNKNGVTGSGTNGGAVFWNSTYCNISYTSFTDNSAGNYGGALYSNADKTELDYVNFTRNQATNNGGAAYIKSDSAITNSNFINNKAIGGSGGAVWFNGGVTKLDYVNFTSNHAGGAGGGDIVIYGTSASISNAYFNGSDAVNDGGAIYLMAPNSRIEDSTFEGTHAMNAGAVYWGGTAGTINNATFIGTSSSWNGGAVYWNANDGTMTFTNFTDINSEGYGGAVYWLGDNANINYGNFTNTSGLSGGAIYLSGNNGAVSKSRFNNTKSRSVNNVEGGGAIHWISSNGNITDCNFTGSSANNNGGAILLDSNNQRIANISIDNSKALKNGGAIYLSESASNANMTNIDIFNATASNGGGVYVNAVGVEFSDSNITNSSANNGGAIYWFSSEGNIYEVILSNNTANDGGALYARSKSGDTQSTTFADITFDKNNATGNGGAICFNGDAGGYSIYNSTFTDNGAGQKGNSIYYYAGSSDNLNNSVYNSNFTGTNHIYIENSMRASLVNNTELNTKNGDYFVYNKGTIALSNNSLRNLIVNYGTILTQVNVTVCENKTYTFDGIYFPLNATAVDDKGNTVVSNSLIFVTNHNDHIQSQIDDDRHVGTLITNKEHYEVNITDAGLKKVNVKIAIINVIAKLGSYTWLQKELDDCSGDVYVLTCNVTFNPDYDLSEYNIYYGRINFAEGMNFNKTIRFEGSNFTISGLNQARIFTVTANDIIINNTNFVNGSTSAKGGALYMTSNNAKIANSTFVNNTANTGGAISSVSNSGLTLGSLTFFNNTASNIAAVELSGVSNAQIKNLDFINNTAANDCGALSFVGSGDVQSLSDCNFINNTAGNDYGAVYISNVNVDSCNFVNNTAQDDYSALYMASGSNALTLTKSNFTGNLANNRATVGIGNANAKVSNCNFTDNEVKASGSAIYVNAQGVEISNNIFDKNIAGANGTVYFESISGKILYSNFTNNKALNGAGVYTGENTGIIIVNSSFISNTATVEAGAIYFASPYGQIQYCNFTNNTAVNGGAIVLAGSNQDIGYCIFEGNNATYKGGSVYVKDGSNNNIHNTTFKKSHAFDGGAVYNSGSTGASLWLRNNTFIKNIASHNGGAVYYVVDADGANPVIYRDYLNFTSDGITSEGVVDAQGRTTLTMKSGGSTYQRIFDCLFKDNEDYILNISAAKDDLDTMVIVYIRNPKDGDKKSTRIVITVNSTDGSYKKQIIIKNETDYNYYFNTYLQSFVVDFRNVTQDKDYNVTVSFEDEVYLYKLNSTSLSIGHGTQKGDFKYLQELINNKTSTASPGTIPVLDLPRNIVFTIGTEIWCDDSCVNITSPIIINGLGYTIDALGQSRIFNITSANVTLKNIKFVKGNSSGRYGDGVDKGGAIFWSNQNGTLMNCEFRDNNATVGGAIYYNSTASYAKISGSYFFNNTAVTNGGAIDCNASEMNLTNTLFELNYAGEYGAALCRETHATGGFGRDNNFTANNAGKAGAALAWMGVNKITINNYIFIDNTAGENGGAIYVDANSNNCSVINSVFEGNNVTSQSSGNGGAIDWLGANATVLNSNFTNNNAFDGGAIYVGSTTGFTNITGSTFTDNGAINNGGAINLVASSVTVNESNFYDNSAINGGALYVGGEGTTNFVYSSKFVNNTATSGRGGAIDWVAAKGEIIDSNFTENSAEYGGGVYFGLKSRNSQIKNVIFTANSATKNGGAIDWNSTDGELYNTQFISNYAGEYGAALCREANATGGHGNNNSFTSNHAGIAGAALAWMDSVGISITNYTFISNIADIKGGAIYINPNSHNCSIIECKFDLNEVTDLNNGHGGAIDCEAANATVTNSSFTKNFAFEGGAIHVDSNSGQTNITNSTFTSNRAIGAGGAINLEASSVTVNGSNFIKNIASDGGALFVGGKGITNYVYNSNFEFNDAGSGHGGAIGWLSSTGHIINSNFTSNSAEYGGGVYLNGNSSESEIRGSRFIGNTANTNGGAIDWNATSGDLVNNYFFNNYAGEYGAALCREANATGGHGYNNTFESNYAEIAGAALAWMNVGNIKIDTYRFINNMAGVGGAAIYIGYGSDNSTILNCVFRGNNITNDTGGHGGAIYCVAENATINNTNFTNNHAFYGGAIFVGTGSGHTNITNTNFTNNGANVDGGALYLRSSSILNNTIFKGNVAGEDGGAIYVDGISEDNKVYSTLFEDNHANSGLGGAINWGSSAGYIVDSNFTLNTADYGGGIYLGGNSVNSRITNVIFANNTATHNGGAIDWNATGGNLTNTTFKGNRAEYGAALCREANATGGFGYNNTFILNHATKSGAALAWMGVNGITIRKYTFINNTADFSGGAIYVSKNSDNCRVINSTFIDNYVSNAVAGRGGAIDWIGNNGTVENTTFVRCVSINGGGIYVGDESDNMAIFNTSFTSCESLTNGGAIVIYGDDASISYSNFTSSVALDNGGAIAGFSSDNTNITNCILKYNMAAGHIDPQGRPYGEGGAIYWENSKNLKVADSIFEANDAHLSGGDISANNCNDSTVYNINTYNATASTNGGSLAWKNSKNLNVDKSYFNDSGAGYSGGSIYLSNINAAIKNTVINSSWASWDVGGGIYVDGDVEIDNVYFNDTHSMHDNATAIYFKSGTSTVSNSNFTISVNSIGISRGANVTLTKNNISAEKPTKDTIYLLDDKFEYVDYAVWNEGNLWLDKNTFDTVIFNNGTIWTPTTIKMLNNGTYNVTWNDNFTFFANITDDNYNTIISVKSLNTSNDVYTDYRNHYQLPYNARTLQCAYQGLFHLTAIDPGLKNAKVYDGTLYVKMPVSVSLNVDQSNDDRIIITATLTPEATSNYTADGSTITFKMGNKVFNVPVENCPGIWSQHIQTFTINDMPSGNYTLTATYNGNDYHLEGIKDIPVNVALRKAWIEVAVQNISYGQNATVVITTNSNGTVRFNLHGKDEIIEVPIVNGRGEFNLTLANYTTAGNHSVGVVLEPNEYYSFAVNQTWFIVSKLNTGITANPTTPILVGDPEIITVRVNENATGMVKITIKGKKYFGELDKGVATFEIYNLPDGRYTNNPVEYMGDDYFNATSTTTSFNVNLRPDYVLYVRVANITYGENATLYASLPVDVDKDVVFVVNNTEYPNVKVLNGVAELTIPNLDVGEYPVVVVYAGDDKYQSKTNMSSFHVKPTDKWILNITVEAHTYGQDTIFNVTLPKNVTKNVNLTIEGVNYTVILTNGTGNLTLNNISGGLHTVVATYEGDSRYLAKTNSTLFYIERAQSNVNLTQEGRNVTATVTTNATGWVKFIVNGKENRVQIVNGNATWANVLINGNNTVVAIYEGNVNFTDSNNSTNFTVSLERSFVNVTATNVTYGNASVITVKVPVAQTGYVKVVVNNGTDIIDIILPVPATGEIKLDATGLNVGEYAVNVTYLGDKVYDVSQNLTTFNVTKANLTANVIAQNVTVDENASFVVTVNNDFNGNVNVTVGGVSYFDNLVEALIYINKLPANDYVARMTFYGDGNYNNKTVDVPFTVSRADLTVINVTIDDVTYPNKAVAVVNMSAKGIINITVDGKVFNGTIDNGEITIDLTGLSAGVKEALVNFTSTDAYYNNASTVVKFVVFKASSQVNLTNESTSVVAKVTDGATGTVTFYVNGRNMTVIIGSNGVARWDNALEIGNNTVVVVYNGDNNFNVSINSTADFTIPKHKDSAVNVTATNVTYGNASVITVKVPKVQTGYVRIVVEGTAIDVTVPIDADGVAKFNATGLAVGRYKVNVTYLGDNSYDVAGNFTYFNITKANLNTTVIPINVTVKQYPEFIVNVNDDFKGSVNITIGGVNRYVGDAKALIGIDKLPAGEYAANVTFYGDNNYNDKTVEVQFTVSRVIPAINVTIDDTTYPGKSVAVIEMSDYANGTINITVDGKVFNGTVMDGKVSIELTGLSAGSKLELINYTSTDNFHFNVTTTSKSIVEKAPSQVNLTNESTSVVAKVTDGATGTVTFYVNGRNNTVPVDANGFARWDDALEIGNNTVVVVYNGDKNFTMSTNSTSGFTIPKQKNSTVNVTATTVVYGNVSVITVEVPKVQTGYVRIIVEGTAINVTAEIKDGKAIFNATDLDVGRYRVNVTYLGNEIYDVVSNFTYFDITKANLTASAVAQNVTVAQDTEFIITVLNDFNGKLRIEVDGKTYGGDVKTIVNDIGKLLAGAKQATVTFYGDNNYNDKVFNPTFTVSPIKSVINVTIADTTYPDGTRAIVKVSGDANGTVDITIGSETFSLPITGGEVEIPITGLDAGVKVASVNFYSNDHYNDDANTTYKFVINKAKSHIEINVTPDDLHAGDSAVINITVSCTGDVIVYIDGKERTDVLDNNRIIINKADLTAGEHTVVVYYPGDNNYESSSASYTFTVGKNQSEVKVDVKDTPFDEVVEITVTTPINQTGYVTITVNNRNYTDKLVGGVAKFNITGLDVDKYTVDVIYNGDENYYSNVNLTTFNVTSIELNPIVEGINVTKDINATFIIDVPDNFNGFVNITVDEITYIGRPDTIITMAKLEAGDKVAKVKFYGDSNYIDTSLEVNFTVSKLDGMMVVKEVVNGSTVVVTLPENATGNVTVVFENGSSIVVNVTNGTAIINLENATPGTQNITVIYSGDENYTDVTINSTITVPKHDTEIKVDVTDITDDGTAIVHIKVPENATGDVIVTIDGKTYPVTLNNGEADVPLENLTVGPKTVIVEYKGDANYTANYTTANFVVEKAKSEITVVDQGNGTVVVVVGDNAAGNVTIKVGDKEFNATVVNGTAVVTVDNVTPGIHEVEVIYSGDANHTNATVMTNITAPKYDTVFDVVVGDIANGTAVVTVTVPENATGNVTLRIDGMNYTAKIDDGKVIINLENLTSGAKTFIVEYAGDDNYAGNYTVGEFDAKGVKASVDPVIIDNGNGTVVVVIGDNATGNVTIKVGDKEFNATVVNGTAVVNITNVTPGDHTVEVIYSGDGNHTGVNITTNITAPKYDTVFDVVVGDIANGTAVVTVTVPENATGNVTLRIDGMNYTAEIDGGKATIKLENLTGGAKTFIVEYAGDDNYAGNYTVGEFDAKGTRTSVDPVIIDNGDGTVVVVVGDNATGNVTVKVGDKEFNATVVNGTAVVNITNVTPGDHTVEVIYSGDGNHTGVNITTNITAPKYDTVFDVVVGDIANGTAVVTVTVPENATGNVTLRIDGMNYTAEIDGGKATIKLENLTGGAKTFIVEYAGDDNYAGNYTVGEFDAKGARAVVDPVIIDNGDGTVVVVVGDNATGNVTVKVGDKEFNATVVNGTAVINITNVTPGDHTVEVIYSGDGNHTGVNITTNITAPKYDAPISISVGEAKEGEPIVITVEVPKGATGDVVVSVGGKDYNGTIDDGKAIVTAENVSDGDHTIAVVYLGDKNYAANTTISNMTVQKAKSETEPSIVDYGNGTVVIVVGDNATGNVTVKVGDKEFNATVVNGTAVVTVDNVTPGVHDVEVIYSGDANHTNSTVETTITAPKYDSDIDVTVSEVKEGETAVITVKVPSDAAGNVTVYIDGKNYTAEVKGGVATVEVENITGGAKTVTVEYSGDEKYSANYTIRTFDVEKEKETPSMIIEKGNNTVIIHVGDNATGNVTVKVGNETYNATIINGTAIIPITNVTPGEHDIEVIYSGDENHNATSINTTVTVDKYAAPISINAGDINVGDKAIITVEVPDDAKGTVTIEIDGIKYTEEIRNGIATFEVENLTAGVKSVFAVFEGDSNYTRNFTTAQFNVSKVDSNLDVEIKDVKVGENVTVTVHVPKDATGQVLIDINGVGYYVNVTDGAGTIEVPYLPEGDYDVNLTYTGDDKYLPVSNITSVKVSKLESFVIPIAHNIEVGENENIQLIVPMDATGTVTVVIDGEEFNFNLNNGALGAIYKEGEKYTVAISGGRGELVISGLPKGEYVVSVKYNGDNKYRPVTNSTIFTVSKQDTQMEIVDLGNGTIKVVLPTDATGDVTVSDGNNTYTAKVVDGVAAIDLNSTTPGKHDVSIKYSGDNDHSSNSTKFIIDIPKYETPISVSVSDINVGDVEIVTVTLPNKATGKVTIEINGNVYTEDVKDGKAIFNVRDLGFGDKTVAVKYSGDDNYLDNYTTGQFTVSKVPSTVKAASKDITVGKDEVITATVPGDATGRVLVDINGVGYYGIVVNGKAKIIIPELESGKYTVKVTYEGDDKYMPSTTTTSFTVSKSKAPISADADDIEQGEDATVIVKVPSDATGTVTISIDGKTYTKEVKDGRAVFIIPGLTKGDYDIDASYSGDRKYDANDTLTDIEVYFNETPKHQEGDDVVGVKEGISLSEYATGNPIWVLLLVILSLGFGQVRRFRK